MFLRYIINYAYNRKIFAPPPMREATVIKSSSIMCMCVAFSIWQIS